MRAIANRILINKLNTETIKNGVIILSKENVHNAEAEVVSVGDLVKYVKVGDKICYDKARETELSIDNLYVIYESDVIGIL